MSETMKITTKNFILDGFHKGQFISWLVTTQAGNCFTVTLYDDEKVYFRGSKMVREFDPPLAQGSAIMEGNKLQLEIRVTNSDKLDTWFNHQKIQSVSTGESHGDHFVLAAEDQPGVDEDYNDLFISITGWNSCE